MKRKTNILILLSCVLCLTFMYGCSGNNAEVEEDGMKTYITFRNSNPGAWEGEKSEAGSKIGIMEEDGSNLRYIDLENMGIEEQNTWSPCGVIVKDMKQFLVLSSRESGMCHLSTTRTNIWMYEIETEEITKLYDVEDRADYVEFVDQLDNDKIMISERVEQDKCSYYWVDINTNEKEEILFIIPSGYTYGPTITPDKEQFIIQHSAPYSIWKCDIEGGVCDRIAWYPNGISFGTGVSFDNKWVVFTYCNTEEEPLHEWADVCIVNIETKEKIKLTDDKSYWLTAYHGDETIRGGGSNAVYFAPFGDYVTLVKGLENSKSPWKADPSNNPDNHFNCVYDESIASGGTGISLLDIYTGEEIVITEAVEGTWDFRPTWNKETHKLLFIRAKTGGKPELWMCDKDGSNQKCIATGYNDVGTDFPRWIQ